MQPELTSAFVSALTGNPDTIIDWRVINDRNKAEQGRNLRGTVSEMIPALQQYNNAGWGVFLCINALDGQGQKLPNVTHIRTHVLDLDDTLSSHASYQQAINSTLPPHIAVQSSPNKYHLYWLVEPYSGNEFFTLQQRKLIQLYKGDESIIDAVRVMRVPGFNHCKGDPVPVTCWATSNNPRYTSAQIEAHLSYINIIDRMSSRSPLGDEKMQAPSLEWATFALNLRDPNTLERADWLLTSAAFRQCAHNFADEQTLLNIWQQWCDRYEGNDSAENMKMWKTFDNGTSSGWNHFRRVTPVEAHINNSGGASAPPPKQVIHNIPQHNVPAPDTTEEFSEILDTYQKMKWFKNCYFVESIGKIFASSGRFMNSTQFNGSYGGKQFGMSSSGSKVVNEAWQAALRATDWTIPKVDHIRFLPEKQSFEIIEDAMGRKGLNTYIPAKIKTREGDVSLWLTHLEKMIPNPNDRHIFCSYLAHCVKYPGYKIPWAIVLQSTEGAGKTIFKDVIQYALGEMYTYSPKAPELVSSGSTFNAWMRSKLAIIVDEIKVDERRDLIEILKPMITDVRVEVQSKGVDQQMEDNCANWMFFTNFKEAIPVGRNGRRYCTFFTPIQNARDLLIAGMDNQYFVNLHNWYEDENGLEMITDWLLKYPVERGSLPHRAPHTSSHEEALKIGRTPLEVMLDLKIEDKEYGFKNGYVSFTMFEKSIASSRFRKPPEHVIKSMLESRGYYEIGRYTHVLSNEDFAKPPLLFALDPLASIENYERSQTG